MSSKRDPLVEAIRGHYSRLSIFYWLLWGEHIHHGYWEDSESTKDAQLNLVRRLANKAGVRQGSRVLDIGCGLGGSSFWLARELDCEVVGITISPVQCWMAEQRARRAGLTAQTRFEVHDANSLDLGSESFDAIWIVECSEHLEDRRNFLRRCATTLRPGGSLALYAWLCAERGSASENPALVEQVCAGMLCPPLSSLSEYVGWLNDAGFEDIKGEDITRRVEQTWDLCIERIRRPWVRALLPFMDVNTRQFTDSFPAIREAYAEDAMAYGMFTAVKPALASQEVRN